MEALVGKPVTRVDALEKVSGAAVFGPDVKLVGMLYGKALRSPHAHARIVSINLETVRKLPGVRAVVTGADMPGVLGGEAVKDMPCLAQGKVRYMGEPVAAVAAEDEATALKAIELIEVVYDELPVAADALAALEKGAPLIHEGLENYARISVIKPVPNSNVITVNEYRKGDVEQGFRESDEVFEDEFRSQTVHHAPLVPSPRSMSVAGLWSGVRTIRPIDCARTWPMLYTCASIVSGSSAPTWAEDSGARAVLKPNPLPSPWR